MRNQSLKHYEVHFLLVVMGLQCFKKPALILYLDFGKDTDILITFFRISGPGPQCHLFTWPDATKKKIELRSAMPTNYAICFSLFF